MEGGGRGIGRDVNYISRAVTLDLQYTFMDYVCVIFRRPHQVPSATSVANGKPRRSPLLER